MTDKTTVKAVTNTINTIKEINTPQYSDVAELYGERFASAFGISIDRAKQILSDRQALNIMEDIRYMFSEHFRTMSNARIVDFLKNINSKRELKLAKIAMDKGVHKSDFNEVYKEGESIFSSPEKAAKKLTHTSKYKLGYTDKKHSFKTIENGQIQLAIA